MKTHIFADVSKRFHQQLINVSFTVQFNRGDHRSSVYVSYSEPEDPSKIQKKIV